jgi:hypothetical protein
MENLTHSTMVECGTTLRSLGASAKHRRVVAERIVNYFYENFRSKDGKPSCVLARCFQTSSYASLPLDYRDAADRLLDFVAPDNNMRCLALLATRGDKSVWNDPATSINHQAIPLPSVEVVRRAPMIARLIEQFGMPIEQFVAPAHEAGFLLDKTVQNFNVFHVPQALASPFIPAQESFVEPFGVQSVLGMGGLLGDGEFFAVILFTRVTVTREVAELFRELALSVKAALLPFASDRVFSSPHTLL